MNIQQLKNNTDPARGFIAGYIALKIGGTCAETALQTLHDDWSDAPAAALKNILEELEKIKDVGFLSRLGLSILWNYIAEIKEQLC